MASPVSLHKQVVNSFLWGFIESAGVQFASFIIGIILARLLTPSEYGMIGLIMILISISQGLVDSGLGAALIQQKDIEDKDISTVFLSNISLSSICYVILYIIAPYVAEYYKQPAICNLLRVLSILIVVNAFGLVQQSLILRKLEFRINALIQFCAVTIGGGIGIWGAMNGYGVWSLVYYRLGVVIIRVVLFWALSPWKVSFVFSCDSFKRLINFGGKLVIVSLADNIFNNIYTLLIGKLYSIRQVGFYNRAFSLQQMPVLTVQNMIGRVAFPFFSRLQDDLDNLRKYYIMFVELSCLVLLLLMGGLFVVAEPVVIILLTDKWAPTIPYLKIFCTFYWLIPIQVINVAVLKSIGKTGAFMTMSLMQKIIIVISIVLSYKFGVDGLIIGFGCAVVVIHFFNVFWVFQYVDLNYYKASLAFLPYFISACVAAFVGSFCSLQISVLGWRVIVSGTVYVLIFVIGTLLLRPGIIRQIRMVRNKLQKEA